MSEHIFTVGHSNHPIDAFLTLLRRNGVTAVADVRSSPYSRFAPHFGKEPLTAELREVGIKYVFLGRELGARTTNPDCYVDGQVSFDRLADTDPFHEGLDRVVEGARSERVAIMCAEKDPLDCHRTLLVANALVDRGVLVDHILADGSVESHDESLQRLLDVSGIEPDLWSSHDDLLQKAMKEREARIAYVDDDLARIAAR